MRNLVKKSLKINGNTPRQTFMLRGDIGTSYLFSRTVLRSKKTVLSRRRSFSISVHAILKQALIDGLNSHQSEDVNPHLNNIGLKKYWATKSCPRTVYIQSTDLRNNASVLHQLDFQSSLSVRIGHARREEKSNCIRNGRFIESGTTANNTLANPASTGLMDLSFQIDKRVKFNP
jgi:hypothetical protein